MLAGACATPLQHAERMAQAAFLQREQFSAGRFVLTSFSRIEKPAQSLTIYIEGDGRAWKSRTLPSDDPSPRKAVGLGLAAADGAPNVVYLARPCQFTSAQALAGCGSAYWTDKRYAEEVIEAIDRAVSHYAARVPGQKIDLVGYSGGGAVAVLVAARRHDVQSLRTVAANLDHEAVNGLHRVAAMPASLNAISVARQVSGIAQIHYSGADDRVVPPFIAESFAAAAGGACSQTRIVAAMGHESDWPGIWVRLKAVSPRCMP